jgi:hypothetical protein
VVEGQGQSLTTSSGIKPLQDVIIKGEGVEMRRQHARIEPTRVVNDMRH